MRIKDISYSKYYTKTLQCLTAEKEWENGVYKHRGQLLSKSHVLPLEDDENTLEHRIASLQNYIGLDCRKCLGERLGELHQYAHHLTSSQQLCMKFFSVLIDDNRLATEAMVVFIKNSFGIDIHIGAKCEFEYKEKIEPYLFDVDKDGNVIGGYEGTSFDFHIQDVDVEIYFEIKFTEKGFNKEKADGRHEVKAAEYCRIAPQFFREIVKEPEEFLKQYQIYRNIIRVTDNGKYVVFISDGNNPATNQDILEVKQLDLPVNIQFKTWQELVLPELYPFELPFQLKAIQNYK